MLLVVALLPFLLAVPILLSDNADDGTLVGFFGGIMISLTIPLIVLVLASSAFGNEVEDRTLSLLTTRPVLRSYIVFAKLAATIAVAAPLAVVPAVVMVSLDSASTGGTMAVAGAGALTCVVTYASIFTWAGLMTSRALSFAVVYVFLWEGLLTSFLEGLRYASVRGYTFAIMQGLDEEGFSALGDGSIELQAGLVGAAAATALFFAATVYRLRRMDVP